MGAAAMGKVMMEEAGYWGFPIDTATFDFALATVGQIKDEQEPIERLCKSAADVVSRLTRLGLAAYYHKPTQIVPLHPVIKKSADSGIAAVMAGLDMVIRQFFKKRSLTELKAISNYLENMLHTRHSTSEPVLIFRLTDHLHQRAVALIQLVRTNERRDDYINEVVTALCDLVEESTIHYYHQPTDMVNLQGFGKKTADVGIAQVQKAIQALIRKLVSELSHSQLNELSHHIESMIHTMQAEP